MSSQQPHPIQHLWLTKSSHSIGCRHSPAQRVRTGPDDLECTRGSLLMCGSGAQGSTLPLYGTPMSEPKSTDSPQVKLMHGWGQGFKKRDLDLIAKYLHKDYRHTTYPRSLDKPEQTREEWLQQFAGIISLWTELVASYIGCSPNTPRND